MYFGQLKTRWWLSIALSSAVVPAAPAAAGGAYAWNSRPEPSSALEARIAPPLGFERASAAPHSFAAWLRALPLKAEGTPVRLFNGTLKARQDVHAAVIDIDTGAKDLQQCADAVMRLRAEWLYATGSQSRIAFKFTGGGSVPFARYAKGERPDARGRKWKTSAKPDASYGAFRRYMDLVFAYAGTASLENELTPVAPADLQIGHVFIQGGFPGHAVIVADIAENSITKSKRMLLIQSYMPAQDMHILKNPANGDRSPWYLVPNSSLVTPEWTFKAGSLRRWP